MDRISIDAITFYAHHGVLPEERELGQVFQVNLELGCDFSSITADHINQAVDYRLAVEVVKEIICGSPCRLLETLAARIADQLLLLPGVTEVKVEVRKPNPPLPEVKGGVGVVTKRRR